MKFTKKKSLLYIFFLCFGLSLSAQTVGEAVQYTFYDYIGTARTAGAGGAFGALGGDQGSIFINPASLGTYRKGEFTISPTYFSSSTKSTFSGNSVTDTDGSGLTFFNMGIVFASEGSGRSKWKTSNISVTYNKMTDFERNIDFEGVSPGTIVERFAERANGRNLDELDPFEAGVAFDSDALYDEGEDLNYEFDARADQEIEKQQSIRSKGGMSELAFSWAGNYDDQLQVGFSLGIPFLNYEHNKIYNETPLDESSPFRSLTYSEFLKTSGSGINLKLGLIYTGLQNFRIGASVASPTAYGLDDEYSTSMSYRYIGNDNELAGRDANSGDGSFEYTLNTPWKTSGSIAYMINTGTIKGFVSAGMDYLNYSKTNFDLTTDSDNPGDAALQRDLNTQISNELQNAMNFRLGGEIAYDIFRVRAGYSLRGSPYFEDDNTFFSGFSIGGGLRFDAFFIDIAYRATSVQQGYYPYNSLNEQNSQLVQLDTNNSYVSTTFGIKF